MILLSAAATTATQDLGPWFLLIFFVLISLVFSFLCSIAEAVLLSVTRPFIQNLVSKGDPLGKKLAELRSDIDRPLAAILTLNTIAHTVGATLAGTQASKLFNSWQMGVFSAVFTLIILIGSEIIPKTIGALYWKPLAGPTTTAIQWLITALKPFVWVSKAITSRMGTSAHGSGSFSREEFGAMAEIASQEGHMDEQESTMLRNLLLFREITVDSIMTPRPVIFMLPATCTVAEFVEEHANGPFSRIPIFGENRDDVKGFILRVQVLHSYALGEKDKTLAEFTQTITSVRPASTVMALFVRMNGKRSHISLVVDDFGAVQGIVTLEDLVETLIGFEIVDETDKNVDMQAVARRLWEERAKRVGIRMEQTKALPAGDQSKALPGGDQPKAS